MNPAEVLIDHALAAEWADLPPAAQQAARTFLHDTICVGVAGANAPYADAICAAAAGWGQGDACSVLGRPELRLPAPSAAFVNAFQIHSQEYDCVHEPAVVHPLATIASVLIAEAERSGPYSGADLLAALSAGVDVAAGLGVAATTPLKFFRPATAGIFGCVAALARLRRLPREVALDALGYALAFAGGTMQAHTEGKPALPVQIANAARGAITAVDVAVAGLPGPLRSIDGPFGYLTLFEDAFDLEPVLASLGKTFRIAEVSWKPFPTGRAAHGAIVATQALMAEHGLTVENLESLTYRAPPLIKRLVGRQVVEGMGPAHARLCFPYLAGVVLTRGAVGLGDFSASSLADRELHAIAAKITVEDDGNPDPAAFTPAVAIARTRDGRELTVEVAAQFGSPAWPLSREQHLEKARSCLAFGGLEAVHARLATMLEDFENLDDAALAFRLAAGRDR
jgi:2-methylcitrate dehydratase PrpD